MTIEVIGPGMIRLDIFTHEGRSAAVLDLHTARAAAILMIEAIAIAEVNEARSTKKAKR